MKSKEEFVQVLEEILEEYAIKSTAKDEVSNKLLQDCICLFKRYISNVKEHELTWWELYLSFQALNQLCNIRIDSAIQKYNDLSDFINASSLIVLKDKISEMCFKVNEKVFYPDMLRGEIAQEDSAVYGDGWKYLDMNFGDIVGIIILEILFDERFSEFDDIRINDRPFHNFIGKANE